MSTTAPDRPTRKGRRLRLTLGGLMALVLVVGGGLGWLVREAGVQREVVRSIEARAGKVYYDWECDEGTPIADRTAEPWRAWLIRWFGPDYGGRVVAVRMRYADDAALWRIGRLTGLKGLEVSGVLVGNAGLDGLRGLVDLKDLGINGCGIDSLDAIAGLKGLESLSLIRTDVGDAAMGVIAGLPRLKRLDLHGSRVTNAGLARLTRLGGLESLALGRTAVDDDGLRHLASFPRLADLGLRNTKVGDAGVALLAQHAGWKSLDLSNTRITEASIPMLLGLPGRPTLWTTGTVVTPEAIRAAEDARAKAGGDDAPMQAPTKP